MTQCMVQNSPIKQGETAVVVGAGASGIAAVKLLLSLGAQVRLVDRNLEAISPDFLTYAHEHRVELLGGEHTSAQFEGAALVVTSPGVPRNKLDPLLAQAGNPPLMGEIELGLYFVQEPIIGITGTSGKTTTSSLLAAMLEYAGKTVFLGGNIGIPLCDYVLQGKGADVLVLELSSFQLHSCKQLHPHVGIFLNLSENHLDQHNSMQEYTDAKFSLFQHQTEQDVAILPANLVNEFAQRGYRAVVRIIEDGAAFTQMRLLGPHNQYNAYAAYLAAAEMGVTFEQALAAARDFTPLAHRLEQVHVDNGIAYVNDSKCTTVDALRVALESFSAPVHLLAGGKFKGGDLGSLRPLLQQKVRSIALYGGSKDVFTSAWEGCAAMAWFETMREALLFARQQAVAGDIILLSPATASYDQYKNYMERGKQFASLARGEA